MKNQFKNNPLTLDELVKWINNQNYNPRSGCKISENGQLYKIINKSYLQNKNLVDNLLNIKLEIENHLLDPIKYLCESNDDRDPISMNLFWEEENGVKKVVYPSNDFNKLIMYRDSKKLIRCFEIESLKYLKTYNITTHPVSCEEIPFEIFDKIEILDISKIQNDKTIENFALDIFQYFSKISIFINYESFLQLDKSALFKFNYELRDFWLQNFSKIQRDEISIDMLLFKDQINMEEDSLENIQKYLLGQLKVLLSCEKEEYKYMINYIIVGALGIVIPEIKEMYPDFSFSF
jgi:hypothetical protein